MTDYYHLLQLSPNASADQIQSAYHRERARLLASSGEDETRIAPQLSALEQAYTVLSDPTQRSVYDQSRGVQPNSALMIGGASNALQVGTAPTRPIEQRACPSCGKPNPIQATRCGHCGEQISNPCPKCGNPVMSNERACGRCGTVIAEYHQDRFMQAEGQKQQIQKERAENQVREDALEHMHRVNRGFGFIFWAVVIALVIGVCVLGGFLLSMSGR